MVATGPDITRCSWARTPLGIAYHDREWGVPVHDDRLLFEFRILEGAQAGRVGRRSSESARRIARRSKDLILPWSPDSRPDGSNAC